MTDAAPSLEELLMGLPSESKHLEGIYHILSRRLTGMIRVAGVPESDVADVLQLVFLDVWHFAKRFEPQRGSAEAWIFKIARHKIIDHQRRMARQNKIQRSIQIVMNESDRFFRDLFRGAELDDVWDRVSSDERQVLILSYYYGFTQKEIARIQQVPIGTVKSRATRGIEKMRRARMPKENHQS